MGTTADLNELANRVEAAGGADRACCLCEGTGHLYLMRSWFPADGYYRQQCGICGGSGKSSYRPDAGYARDMRRQRAAALRARQEKNA